MVRGRLGAVRCLRCTRETRFSSRQQRRTVNEKPMVTAHWIPYSHCGPLWGAMLAALNAWQTRDELWAAYLLDCGLGANRKDRCTVDKGIVEHLRGGGEGRGRGKGKGRRGQRDKKRREGG